MSRILQALTDPNRVGLRARGDAWSSSWLSRQTVPNGWVLLVISPGGERRVYQAGDDPRPDSDDSLIFVRRQIPDLSLGVDAARSNDDHTVTARGTFRINLPSDPSDLASFAGALLHRGDLFVDELEDAIGDAGARRGLIDYIRRHDAARLVEHNHIDDFGKPLQAALERFSFETGIMIERLTSLILDSPTLRAEQQRSQKTASQIAAIESRAMVEQASRAATMRRLDDLGDLLGKLKNASGGRDATEWHELLPALNPAERSELLSGLWRITPDDSVADAIVAVVGNECVWLDPANPVEITRRVAFDDSLGALRSVAYAADRDVLLVGAASGVWLINAHAGASPTAYAIPCDQRPRTGINAAELLGDLLYATHSQLGCWCWALSAPDAPGSVLVPQHGRPKTIRAVTALDDLRVAFAADDTVHVAYSDSDRMDTLPTAEETISTLSVVDDRLYAGTDSGGIVALDLDLPDAEWRQMHKIAGRVESISPRVWNDLVELVIPAGSQGVYGLFGEEPTVARLAETPTTVRRVWATDDVIVSLSEARDQLFITHAAWGGRETKTAPVARWCGHSIQDAVVVMHAAGPSAIPTD
jgi:hypothetical protein